MQMMKSNKLLSAIEWIVIAIISVALSLLFTLSSFDKAYTYNASGADADLLSLNYEVNDASFDMGTGNYSVVPGGDSYLLYTAVNSAYKGVYLSLKEPALYDTVLKVYWTGAGDEALSEKLSKSCVITAGSNSGFVTLSNYDLNLVRVNISNDCVIDKLVLTKSKAATSYSFGDDSLLFLIIRFVLIYLVLILAYMSFKERALLSSGEYCVKANKTGTISAVKSIFIDTPKNPAAHKYEYDYIRTLAAVLVITMHSICDIFVPQVTRGDAGYGTLKFVLAVSLGCNVLYVMLSGSLILQPKDESIKDFYTKRMVKVIIPTLCYFGLYMLLGYPKEVFGNGIWEGLKSCGKDLLSGRPAYMPHVWLVYTILGLYILAPFLRIMLSHIKDSWLFGLLVAGFIINCLTMYLPLAGLTFGIETPIASWVGIFLLGYYMTTDHAKKFYNVFIVLGIAGFIASFLMIYYNPNLLYYTCNWTPNMWLVGCGIFAFFSKFKGIFGKRNIVIGALSKYNFSIMLIHILLLMKVVLPIGWRLEYEYGHLSLFIVGIIIVCFVLSYVLAVIFDNTAVAAVMYLYNKCVKKKV